MPAESRLWNHNIHYHRLILDAVPKTAHSGLDIGCGNGLLALELRELLPEVTAIDTDAAVLEAASLLSNNVAWVRGDAMSHMFGKQFDVVTSVATLHHFPDLELALSRLADLTSPGGVLAIIGVARTSRMKDMMLHLGGAVQHQWLSHKYGFWEHTAPTVWPPKDDYETIRRTAKKILPGVRWKQLLLWRYSLLWCKPSS